MKDELFPPETLEMINSVKRGLSVVGKMWQEYHKTLGLNSKSPDLGYEAEKRFKQLDFLFTKIVSLEEKSRASVPLKFAEITASSKGVSNKALNRDTRIAFQTELYTESVYYLAARLAFIIGYLTGSKAVETAAIGVLQVRNNLIEHSQKSKDNVTSISFGHVGQFGPQVKPARPIHQENTYHDPGLYKNLDEMLVGIKTVLVQYRESVAAQT